jgi:hypothetical protein
MAARGQRSAERQQHQQFDVRRLLEPYGATINVPQLAELLNQTPEAIRQKAVSGDLPGRKLPGGRTYFFFTEELAPVLERTLVAAADAETDAGQTTR